MKKILTATLFLSLLLMGCGGNKEENKADDKNQVTISKKKKVGFAQESNAHPFRIAETESLKKSAVENGFDFVFTDGENDLAKQVSNIENLIAQGVDYIIVAPRESDGFEEVFMNAKQANIPVILIDRSTSGIPGDDFTAVVTSDFVWEGEQAAKWFLENMDGNINVVELAGTPGSSVAIDRQNGFKNIVEINPRLNIIASQVGDFYRSNGQKVMANILQAQGKDINAVYAHNDEMALGAVAAIKEAGLEPGKDIKIIGIDGQKEAKEAIEKGEMNVTITCDPHFGEKVFEIISDLENGKKVEPIQFVVDKVYDNKNISQYKNAF